MKCFFHQDRDAVGICKSCERGLCSKCAVDLHRGLACKGRCEDDAKALIEFIQSNVRSAPKVSALLHKARSAGFQSAGMYVVLGIVLLAWGFTSEGLQFTAVLGALFVIYGIICAARVFTTPQVGGDEGTTQPGLPADAEDRAG